MTNDSKWTSAVEALAYHLPHGGVCDCEHRGEDDPILGTRCRAVMTAGLRGMLPVLLAGIAEQLRKQARKHALCNGPDDYWREAADYILSLRGR